MPTQLNLPQPGGGFAGNPGDYALTGDPQLSGNTFGRFGIAPKRIYTSGIAFSGTLFVPPSAIAVWHSDDGGVAWSDPVPVASTGSSDIFLDKPSIAVSQWTQGTQGEVFVAYTIVPRSGDAQIHVARSTDGGLSFPQDTVVATGNVNMPQVLVDEGSGIVTCLWEQFANAGNGNVNAIMMAISITDGLTWFAQSTITSTNGAVTTGSAFIGPPFVFHGVRMPTVITARRNPVAQGMVASWQALSPDMGSPDGFKADIFVAAETGGGPWSVSQVPGVTRTNDQFEPAVNSDGLGQNLVSYYSRKDSANTTYRAYSVILDSTGANVVRGEEAELSIDTDPGAGPVPGFVGDYHDVWWTTEYSGRWQDASIMFASNANQVFDVWLTALN